MAVISSAVSAAIFLTDSVKRFIIIDVRLQSKVDEPSVLSTRTGATHYMLGLQRSINTYLGAQRGQHILRIHKFQSGLSGQSVIITE
jgi:hypothetical protein